MCKIQVVYLNKNKKLNLHPFNYINLQVSFNIKTFGFDSFV